MILRKRNVCLIIHYRKEKHQSSLLFPFFPFPLKFFPNNSKRKKEGGEEGGEEEENYIFDVTRGSYIIFDVYLFNSYISL